VKKEEKIKEEKVEKVERKEGEKENEIKGRRGGGRIFTGT
jgi:hypothetical protein